MDSQVKNSRYNRVLNIENEYRLLKKLSSEIKILLINNVVITATNINSY